MDERKRRFILCVMTWTFRRSTDVISSLRIRRLSLGYLVRTRRALTRAQAQLWSRRLDTPLPTCSPGAIFVLARWHVHNGFNFSRWISNIRLLNKSYHNGCRNPQKPAETQRSSRRPEFQMQTSIHDRYYYAAFKKARFSFRKA